MKEKTVLWKRVTEKANSSLAANGYLTSQTKGKEIWDHFWECKETSWATLDFKELI